MKTIDELETDIGNITQQIYTEYPELAKFIGEIPNNSGGKNSDQIGIKKLQDYYNSLAEIVSEYAKTHEVKSEYRSPEALSFEGYPQYPPSDDIYSQVKQETELNPDDISKKKTPTEEVGTSNEKSFDEDMSGDDLDVPGSELDDQQESVGSEDEENNYYSLGGDDHPN